MIIETFLANRTPSNTFPLKKLEKKVKNRHRSMHVWRILANNHFPLQLKSQEIP